MKSLLAGLALLGSSAGALAAGRVPVLVEKVLELRYKRAAVVETGVLARLGLAAGHGVGLRHDDALNTLTVTGAGEDVARVVAAVGELDRPSPQLLIEATVLTAEPRRAAECGLGAPVAAGVFSKPLPSTGRRPDPRTLESRGRGRVLAQPRMLAIDGERAELKIGDAVRFQGTGGPEVLESGLTLQALPRFAADGTFALDLHVEVTRLPQHSERKGRGFFARQERDVLDVPAVPMRDDDSYLVGYVPPAGQPGDTQGFYVILKAHVVEGPHDPRLTAR